MIYNEVQEEENCAGNNFLNWELGDWNLYTLLLFISVLCKMFWSSFHIPPTKNTLTHVRVHTCSQMVCCTLLCSLPVIHRGCVLFHRISSAWSLFLMKQQKRMRTCLNLLKKCYKKLKKGYKLKYQGKWCRKKLKHSSWKRDFKHIQNVY
jgi:hypothetical protein